MAPLFLPVKGSLLAGIATGACLLAWFYLDHAHASPKQATRREVKVTVRRTPRAAMVRWMMVASMLVFQLAVLPNPFAMMFWTLVFCSKRRPTETEGTSLPIRLLLGLLPLACVACVAVPVYQVMIATAPAPGATLWWHYAIGVTGIVLAYAADPIARRLYPAAVMHEPKILAAAPQPVTKTTAVPVLVQQPAQPSRNAGPRRRRAAKRRRG